MVLDDGDWVRRMRITPFLILSLDPNKREKNVIQTIFLEGQGI
jgi:hypothetical protein